MAAYIALLRAVNVGGTGKLPMSDLKAMCEKAGFGNVRTYIASGNVVFDSQETEGQVKATMEAALAAYAGKPVGVLVRTASERNNSDNPSFSGRAHSPRPKLGLANRPGDLLGSGYDSAVVLRRVRRWDCVVTAPLASLLGAQIPRQESVHLRRGAAPGFRAGRQIRRQPQPRVQTPLAERLE
jgi:Protein of unknown function (DUF1697)